MLYRILSACLILIAAAFCPVVEGAPVAESPITEWTNPLVKPSGNWKAWVDDKKWHYAWISEKAGDSVEVPAEDKRIVYEWIDAMIPYYPTSDYAHLNARGNRDKWGDADLPKLKPWVLELFKPIYTKNCASCHKELNDQLKHSFAIERQWWWFDLSVPGESPLLFAHLPKKDGGRGIDTKGKFSFSSKNDPLWIELKSIAEEASKEAWRIPEADMPGFIPRSRGRCEYRP